MKKEKERLKGKGAIEKEADGGGWCVGGIKGKHTKSEPYE